MDKRFSNVAALLLSTHLGLAFQSLAEVYDCPGFGRFVCSLFERSRKANCTLKAAIKSILVQKLSKNQLPYYSQKFKRKATALCFFELVPLGVSKKLLRALPPLRASARSLLSKLLLCPNFELMAFRQLQSQNAFFREIAESFFDSKSPSGLKAFFRSFRKLPQASQLRAVHMLAQLSPAFFKRLLLFWRTRVERASLSSNWEPYLKAVFKAIEISDAHIPLLDASFAALRPHLSVLDMTSLFNALEDFIENCAYSPKADEALVRNYQAVMEQFCVDFSKKSWRKYLRVRPFSSFSEKFFEKILLRLDKFVQSANLSGALARKGLAETPGRPSPRLESLLGQFERALGKPGSGDKECKTPVRELALVYKAHVHPDLKGVFAEILGVARTDPRMATRLLKSEVVASLASLAEKVVRREVEVGQCLLLEHFGLQDFVKAALVFSGRPIKAGEGAKPSLHQMMLGFKDAEFEQSFAQIRLQLGVLGSNEALARTIRQDPLLSRLFDLDLLAKQEQEARCFSSLKQAPSFWVDRDSPLSQLQVTKLAALECPLKRRLFVWRCCKQGFFGVLDNRDLVSAAELELLCLSLALEPRSLPEQTAFLGMGEFNAFFSAVEAHHARLVNFAVKFSKCPAKMRRSGDFDESLLFFKFWLLDISPESSLSSELDSKLSQKKLVRFTDKLAEVEAQLLVKQKLTQFPLKITAAIPDSVLALESFTKSLLWTRAFSLPELVSLQTRAVAKLEKLLTMTRDPLAFELLCGELTQAVQCVCEDLPKEPSLGNLDSFDLPVFKNLLESEPLHKTVLALVKNSVSKGCKVDSQAFELQQLKRALEEHAETVQSLSQENTRLAALHAEKRRPEPLLSKVKESPAAEQDAQKAEPRAQSKAEASPRPEADLLCKPKPGAPHLGARVGSEQVRELEERLLESLSRVEVLEQRESALQAKLAEARGAAAFFQKR